MSKERMNGRGIPKSLITIFSLTAWFAVFILIAATLWNIYGPEKAVPDEKRQDAGLKVVDQMADQIRKQRGDTNQVILLHFANDPTDFVTDSIRSKMNSSGMILTAQFAPSATGWKRIISFSWKVSRRSLQACRPSIAAYCALTPR